MADTQVNTSSNSAFSKLGRFNPLWVVLGLLLILGIWMVSGYNGLVQSRTAVQQSLGDLKSQYQRRSDLIPNLVSTVSGAANFERTTLTDVTSARARATQTTIDPSNSTPEQIQAYFQAQNGVSSALSRLLVVTENYPQLQATAGFRELQTQLEGTENRIATARRDYNQVVGAYNNKIQTFPNNLTAGIFGFRREVFFENQPGSENAPNVNFNFSSSASSVTSSAAVSQ